MSNSTAQEGTTIQMYAVFRNGVRVSDEEYESKLFAKPEYDYWQRLLNRWPDGSKLDIRPLKYSRRYNRV